MRMAAYPTEVFTTSKETRCPKSGDVPRQLRTSPSVKLTACAFPSGSTRPVWSDMSWETMVPLNAIRGIVHVTFLPYGRLGSLCNGEGRLSRAERLQMISSVEVLPLRSSNSSGIGMRILPHTPEIRWLSSNNGRAITRNTIKILGIITDRAYIHRDGNGCRAHHVSTLCV